MPDEKPIDIVPVPAVEAPPKSDAELLPKPAPPVDELGETLGQFLSGMQAASLHSMKSLFAQFKTKADAVITKLDTKFDVDAGGDPPKKP
jgi:hypothetical protein